MNKGGCRCRFQGLSRRLPGEKGKERGSSVRIVSIPTETRTLLRCRPSNCRASEPCLRLGPVACTSGVLEL
jgi:hypothetical protein